MDHQGLLSITYVEMLRWIMPYDDQVALGIVYRMFHTLKMRVEFIGFVVVLVCIISWEYYLAKETYRWFASTDPIAVDHDKDGDIDLTDISASLAALSNDALLKIRAYADELGDGDGELEGGDVFSAAARAFGHMLVLSTAAYLWSEYRVRTLMARASRDYDARYGREKEEEIAGLQERLEDVQRRLRQQAGQQDEGYFRRVAGELEWRIQESNRELAAVKAQHNFTRQQLREKAAALDLAHQRIQAAQGSFCFRKRFEDSQQQTAHLQSTIWELEQFTRRLQEENAKLQQNNKKMRTQTTAMSQMQQEIERLKEEVQQLKQGSCQAAPEPLQAGAMGSESETFRGQRISTVSSLPWERFGRGEKCLDPMFFPREIVTPPGYIGECFNSFQIRAGVGIGHRFCFYKLMTVPEDGRGTLTLANVAERNNHPSVQCIGFLVHDPSTDSELLKFPMREHAYFRFWLKTRYSPDTPGMNAEQFKYLIDNTSSDKLDDADEFTRTDAWEESPYGLGTGNVNIFEYRPAPATSQQSIVASITRSVGNISRKGVPGLAF